ncbi:SAM-dependent methyltransferase [Nocardia sp. NPDC048505]|uniref:SAM-dependent methyltransferase n=1 Tax=Nocardia sp. NPDC048505 TaxID=3155756 RepID=UPI0033DD1F5D
MTHKIPATGAAPGELVAVPDPSRPHSGRVHDFLLGGKDYYAADSAVGHQLLGAATQFRTVARAARRFLLRGVGYTVEQGVRQILELGSGYPCDPNLHELAQQINPEARTLYIDNDPIVATHGRALLAEENTEMVAADITDTGAVLAAVEDFFELTAPITVCFGFVLEFVEDAAGVVRRLAGALPAGSAVVLSHITTDHDGDIATRAAEVYTAHGIDFYPRSRTEIADLFTGCELADPGLVAPQQWWAAEPPWWTSDAEQREPRMPRPCCYAAVGWLR